MRIGFSAPTSLISVLVEVSPFIELRSQTDREFNSEARKCAAERTLFGMMTVAVIEIERHANRPERTSTCFFTVAWICCSITNLHLRVGSKCRRKRYETSYRECSAP